MLKGEPMKAIYAKTILYAYPKMEMVLNVLDDLAERKALSAFGDVRPCEELAQRIIDITIKKDLVIKLKLLCDFVINKMTPEDQMIINYKFSKQKPNDSEQLIKSFGCNFYRKVARAVARFARLLESCGYSEGKFEYLCNEVHLFSTELKMTKEKERYRKRKKKITVVKEKSAPQERILKCA